MVTIGIDPGKAGGIAFLDGNDAVAFPMPETEAEILEVLRETYLDSPKFALLEFVRSSPQMGVKSAFTFGSGYGGLRMALVAAKIPFEEVTPGTWQKAMGCLSKGDKNVTKRRAMELFPQIKVTHAIADCLLIAEHCRRVHGQRGAIAA